MNHHSDCECPRHPDSPVHHPKPTGEWTEHYVENELKLSPLRIVMAHNAALAAKDELHAAALQVLERHHQKQLAAAEREVGTYPLPDGRTKEDS